MLNASGAGRAPGSPAPGETEKPSHGASGWMENLPSQRTGPPSPGDAHRTELHRASRPL